MLVSLSGTFSILFFGRGRPHIIPFLVAIAKFGISGTFVLLYVSTVDVFPTLFSVTALGYMNFAARLFTILDPQVAEREEPIPMLITLILTFVAMIAI